jgi:hypothetical protein
MRWLCPNTSLEVQVIEWRSCRHDSCVNAFSTVTTRILSRALSLSLSLALSVCLRVAVAILREYSGATIVCNSLNTLVSQILLRLWCRKFSWDSGVAIFLASFCWFLVCACIASRECIPRERGVWYGSCIVVSLAQQQLLVAESQSLVPDSLLRH